MKLIILDHFRRWWWVWAVGGLFYGAMAFGTATGHPQAADAFPVGIFVGSFLLAMDAGRGHARALFALPVKSSEIARAWWLATVAIPAVLLAVISGAAFGVACLTQSVPPVPGPMVHCWLVNLLLLGVTFFFIACMPPKGGSGDWKQQLRGGIFGGLYGLTCGGWAFCKGLDFHTPPGWIVLGIGAVLTVFGWFRAETMVGERAGQRSGSTPPGKKSATPSRCAEGHGGLWFLAQSLFTRMLFMGLAMFTAVFIIFACMIHTQAGLSSRDFLAGNMVALFTFQFMWMMSIQFFVFAHHLRYLRVMPVTTATLARVLLLAPLAAMVVVYGFSLFLRFVFFQTPCPGLEELVREGCLLQISSATITIPLLIWRGLDMVNYLIGMAIMMGGIFSTIFFTGKIPMAVNAGLPPLILIGVYVASRMLLERSSHTYRPRTNQFGGWNWGRS